MGGHFVEVATDKSKGAVMIVDEDTGEDIICPICDMPDYWECGHLVASFDKTFCECQGGEIYGRFKEFTSIVENVFLSHLKNSSELKVEGLAIGELWASAEASFDPTTSTYTWMGTSSRGL